MADSGGPITVWIDAFIPLEVAGYTQKITKGLNFGRTAIPLPAMARLDPFNTFKDWSAGYLTDQRSFSADPTSSARMRSLAVVQLSPASVTPSHTSSGTTQVNIASGNTTGFGVANMSRCSFGTLTQAPVKGSSAFPTPQLPRTPVQALMVNVLTLTVKGAASDPLVSLSADIDYEGMFTFKLETGRLTVQFDGEIDAFPAFECYASWNNSTKSLFEVSPPTGNTVVNLVGSANRPVKGIVIFP